MQVYTVCLLGIPWTLYYNMVVSVSTDLGDINRPDKHVWYGATLSSHNCSYPILQHCRQCNSWYSLLPWQTWLIWGTLFSDFFTNHIRQCDWQRKTLKFLISEIGMVHKRYCTEKTCMIWGYTVLRIFHRQYTSTLRFSRLAQYANNLALTNLSDLELYWYCPLILSLTIHYNIVDSLSGG